MKPLTMHKQNEAWDRSLNKTLLQDILSGKIQISPAQGGKSKIEGLQQWDGYYRLYTDLLSVSHINTLTPHPDFTNRVTTV